MSSVDQIRNVFEDIYANDTWNGGSGPGSHPLNTAPYRVFLQEFMGNNSVKTVTDLGCGDWQFSRLMSWDGINYTGFDLVPKLIEEHRVRYGSHNIQFFTFDNISQIPGGDLLVSKEVLQHLSNEMVVEYIDHIRSKYKWALLTNSVGPGWRANGNIAAGGYRPLRLDQSPFQIPGAVVLKYFVQSGDYTFINHTYLVNGDIQ